MKKIQILFIIMLFTDFLSAQNDSIIILKRGTEISANGIIKTNEWTDADSLFIEIQPGWISTVYYKHDSKYLSFAFTNLEQVSGSGHVIDILFDKLNNNSESMDDDDLWLHASYSDCEAIGAYYQWTVGENCNSSRPGWVANNLPFTNGNDNFEFRIGLSKIDYKTIGDTLGFSIVLSGNKDTNWPEGANIANPTTWGLITFIGNMAPYVNNPIPYMTIKVDSLFTYQLPDSTFHDEAGSQSLRISANLPGGESLPEWLTFDTTSNTFSGTPIEIGSLYIDVTAIDTAGLSQYDRFKLTIEQTPNVINNSTSAIEVTVFPNPASGQFTLFMNTSFMSESELEIYNMQGKLVLAKTIQNTKSESIDLTGSPKGVYILKLYNETVLYRKIVID